MLYSCKSDLNVKEYMDLKLSINKLIKHIIVYLNFENA